MSEIERAIEIIEDISFCDHAHKNGLCTYSTTGCSDCDISHAKIVALTALREQTEREKGCNYCLQTWPDRAAAGVSDIWHGNKLSVGYGVYREIKFCPMCGKRLEVEP